MDSAITSLIGSYGYVILFLLVGLESLGIPLPGETALIAAAAFAASGHMSIYAVVATAAVAAILGDNGGYWIGRTGGLELVRRYGHFVRLDEAKIGRAHDFFQKHGAKTVFIGRFIALLRTWAAVLAGVAEMKYSTFMLFNITGGITWAIIFGTLGYAFGRNLPKLEHYVRDFGFVVTLLAVLTVSFFIGARWFRKHSDQLSERVPTLFERLTNSPAIRDFRGRHLRIYDWIVRRSDPAGYFGLYLTLGLIISLTALWLFGSVTEDVIDNDQITQLDLTLLDWFRTHITPLGLRIFEAISWLGAPLMMTVLGAVVAIILALRRRWLFLAGWTAALAGAGILNAALKHVIQRPRPIYAAEFLTHYSYSYPSGHAMESLVGYGMLAYLLIVFSGPSRRLQSTIVLAAAILIGAIGLSRLCLGVHYLSDIMGGYSGGVFWLSACIAALEITRRQPKIGLNR